MHHLVRVARPPPSRRHPLSGLWVADYGAANGLQIVAVGMDFTGPEARIVAMKVRPGHPKKENTFGSPATCQ